MAGLGLVSHGIELSQLRKTAFIARTSDLELPDMYKDIGNMAACWVGPVRTIFHVLPTYYRSMSSPYATADHEALDTLVLVGNIVERLRGQLLQYDTVESKADYIQNSHLIPDSFTEFYCVLSNQPCASHKWLWLIFLNGMCTCAYRILLLEQKIQYSKIRGVDPAFLNARAAYAQSFSQVLRFLSRFFIEIDLDWLVLNSHANKLFLQFLTTSVDICLLDPVSIYTISSLVDSMASVMRRYARVSGNVDQMSDSDRCVESDLFPILAKFAKLAYLSGNCKLTLPLVCPEQDAPLVTDKLVPLLLSRKQVSLNAIVDYYRYYAYSLITSVVEHERINDRWLNQADQFLKVLLQIPSLHVDNYITHLGSAINPSRYVSAAERGEMSFFFIMCYLLRLVSFADLVDPEKHFTFERQYFLTSFNKRVATELDISASSSSSRAGSVVSMTKFTEPLHAPPSNTTNRTLGSILYQGSYKEKVRLVVDFINLIGEDMTSGSIKQIVNTFDFALLRQSDQMQINSADGEISHVLSRIDKNMSPGKALFVGAIDKIVRLVQLLAIKEFSATFGDSMLPDNILAVIFESHYPVDEVLRTKDLLVFEGGKLVPIMATTKCSEETKILRQFDTLELTGELEQATQALTR